MKKNFFYLALTMIMVLFTACSQEEAPGTPDIQSKRVSILAQLPTEAMKTRALPSKDGHDLRCILEIWSTGNNPELMYRDEKLALEAVDNKLSFEFTLDPGDYKFLMWADFVISGTGQTNGHYADKFYDTNDLKNITLKDASLLYNTDACDAFFAAQEFTKTEDIDSFDATLKRPFAKLIVSEKNKANFAKCAKVTINHKVPQGFNVEDGSVSTTLIEATSTEVAPLGTGDADLKLFSYYVFAAIADDALGEIKLTFKDAENKELRSTAIPAGVSVIRNRCTQAKGHLVAEATVNGSLDVDFSDDWESGTEENVDPVDPTPAMEIGDYYYSDGSWSTTLDETKTCIGVVYAVDAQYGEKASDYSSDYARIKGYVMALESTVRLEFCSKEMLGTINFTGLELNQGGYKNTKDLLADNRYMQYSDKFLVVGAFITFKEQTTTPNNSSGWYIPSFEQLIDMSTSYFGEGENAKNNTFVTAVDAIGANQFTNSPTSGRYLLSSSITNQALYPVLINNGVLNTNQKAQVILNQDASKAGVQGQIRPILTVLE